MHNINTEQIIHVSHSMNENNNFLQIRVWHSRNIVQNYRTRWIRVLKFLCFTRICIYLEWSLSYLTADVLKLGMCSKLNA